MSDKIHSEFGGTAIQSFNGFLPTIKTALFLLAGKDLKRQMIHLKFFDNSNILNKKNILRQIKLGDENPITHRYLSINENILNNIISGKDIEHEYSPDFPAQKLTTLLEWEDLVLCESTSKNLNELLLWPEHGKRLIEEYNMQKTVKQGYKALFYGPSGTGKTITAALIGKKVNKPVYRIDLSQIVSKYIGETEKNLEKVFKIAENKDWILFFDEADALFGKRTKVNSSNDRFANQEIAYLLQRVESCDNIVVLASNLKENVDKAFARRFQSIIYFPLPTEKERLILFKKTLPEKLRLDNSIDLNEIAKKCDVSGGSIVNVVRYAALVTMANKSNTIKPEDLLEGLRREFAKQGRSLYGIMGFNKIS